MCSSRYSKLSITNLDLSSFSVVTIAFKFIIKLLSSSKFLPQI